MSRAGDSAVPAGEPPRRYWLVGAAACRGEWVFGGAGLRRARDWPAYARGSTDSELRASRAGAEDQGWVRFRCRADGESRVALHEGPRRRLDSRDARRAAK